MVSLQEVQASNSCITSTLPDLVAVFVGATSGIGEYTLKQFAKYARRPRVYFIGQSQEAGDRIASECSTVNPEGKFVFIKANVSLIRNVDNVCNDIKSKEKAINLLFLSPGTLVMGINTSEGLDLAAALIYYCRARFILNLLPLLQNATSLRRVVSVAAGTKEGPVDTTDFQGRGVGLFSLRGHVASLITMSHETLAKRAPEVSFIHTFPGPVKSGIGRGSSGVVMWLLWAVLLVIGPWYYIPNDESGERHLFLATSAKYPARSNRSTESGVPLVARGTDGNLGSGAYAIDEVCESAGSKVEKLLTQMKKDGTADMAWRHTEGEFERITGQGVA